MPLALARTLLLHLLLALGLALGTSMALAAPPGPPAEWLPGQDYPADTLALLDELPELAAFVEFCRDNLTVNEGGPLVVEPFQIRMLADYFRGARSSLILISKKNGKTSLLGALALFHLLTTPDAECVIAAASRDQAGIMLRQIRGYIRRSPALGQRLKVTQRVVSYEALGGQIRILASDVDTVDGAIPTLVLIDELHRHKNPDVYGVLRDGLGPRDGRMITISTAGDDETSPLGELRKRCHEAPGMVHVGAYRYVQMADPDAENPEEEDLFVMHEWALEPDDDRGDMALVKTANPASWQTVRKLRGRKNDPSMKPWQWARFGCGVWLAGEQSAISDKEWRACEVPDLEIPGGARGVYIGVDLGWKWDTTALVPAWRATPDAPILVSHPRILTPPRDGTSLSFAEVWDACVELATEQGWEEVTVVLDPEAGGEQLAQELAQELPNVRVVTHSQKNEPMCLAAERLSETVAAGPEAFQHPGHAGLTAHVLSAVARVIGERWRFKKHPKRKAPIDACIALAMAVSTLLGDVPLDPNHYRIELL